MKGENILRALVERRFTKAVWTKIKDVPKRSIQLFNTGLSVVTMRILSRHVSVENNKIIFLSFRGSYDCNPKWICEEIIRRELPYKLVWVYRNKTLTGMEDFPRKLKLVRLGTFDFFKELSSAKIIVDNGISTVSQFYKKKSDQYLIETWHGSLGIKKFSKDTNKDKMWIRKASREGKMTDFCISNSTFETEQVYRDTFWKETPVWLHGHARNDILFELDANRSEAIRKKVANIYKLEEGTKICLYAPTFRDDSDTTPYELDYDALLNALKERFGGEWVIFARFHYRIWNKMAKKKLQSSNWECDDMPSKIINVTNYPDIQELEVCTDVAITDYSSWICEYMLTRRPGFLYATDVRSFEKHDRAFFFPLNTMPFPVAENEGELFNNILKFDNELYVSRCEQFLRDMGSVDDGHAAERTVVEIEKLIGGI